MFEVDFSLALGEFMCSFVLGRQLELGHELELEIKDKLGAAFLTGCLEASVS